jgi:hypothetical protein
MIIVLRPHHLLDILRDYGYGIRYEPHEYGHALHIVAEEVWVDPDREIELVVKADDICRPCRMLRVDGSCGDTMQKDGRQVSKQAYNDALDRRLLDYLGCEAGSRMTVNGFLIRIRERLDGLTEICTHPGEEKEYRKMGMVEGWKKLGPRRS